MAQPAIASSISVVLLVPLVFAGIVLLGIAFLGFLVGARLRLRSAELEAKARSEMVAKGYGAEEIAAVLRASRFTRSAARAKDAYTTGGLAPCDVAALDGSGEFVRALLLNSSADGSKFLVHFVGQDLGSNAWLEREKIRFPASIAFDETADKPWQAFPFALHAMIDYDGHFLPGYVITRRGEMSYVCFVEQDWDANEWVDESRIRYESPYADTLKPAPLKELFDL
jgi:hypothetical protein